ncbi:MAG: TonB-dependent receptor [Blastocatellia bacterium]|nr:TonB-dependent receptor [Blastocatellia bacterium]
MTRTLTILLISLLSFGVASAQTNRGGISGTVSDNSGAAVAGATVIITNLGTNQATKLVTSDSGAYNAPSLEPVNYSVTVQAQGFKKGMVANVKVDTASFVTVNVTLEPGQLTESVSVAAEVPLLNTESGTTGNTITQRQLTDLPLMNRSVLDLAATLPNVSGDVGFDQTIVTSNTTAPGFNLSLNGGRPGSTIFLADGANNTGVSLSRTMVTFSPETIQEFTVQTSAYSAEYGSTGGGIINATTKSGTNQFNGTALAYLRNPAVAAAPWTNAVTNRPEATLRSNQFSLAAGGPIWLPKKIFGPLGYDGRDRTFFFAAIEPYYRLDHVTAYALLPTAAMRNGDFSNTVTTLSNGSQVPVPADVAAQFPGITFNNATIYQTVALVNGNQFQALPVAQITPFPGNRIPQNFLDQSALKSLQYVPMGGAYFVDPNGQLENFSVLRFVREDTKQFTIRLDQKVTEKNSLNFRITRTPGIGEKGFSSSVNGNGADYSVANQILITDTHTFSPRLINELRLNYTRGRFSNDLTPEYDPNTGKNINTDLGLPNLTKGGMPLLTNGLGTFGNIGSGGSTQVEDVEERYEISDIVYLNSGSRNWKFGVDLGHSLQNVTGEFTATGGSYTFTNALTNSTGGSGGTGGIAFASFLMGTPNSYILRNALIPYYYRWNDMAAFVQNDWKVNPNLTLNLGLRYSLELPRTEKYDHQGVFRPDLAQTFPLSSPMTLTNGQVIDSVLVPPFEFAGKGGNSRYLYDPDYKDFEPRFGFAWSPNFGWNAEHHLVLRGGYGISHIPVAGFDRLPRPDFSSSPTYTYPNENQVNGGALLRLGSNPPLLTPISPDQAMGIPANGLNYSGSLNYQSFGYAVSNTFKTPYVQNWNLTIDWEFARNTVIEFAYIGSKGTHLFMPNENINPKNFTLIDALTGANIDPTATINDPLGRVSPTGAVIKVQQGSLGSPYLGFSSLTELFDASANSIRHAAYVNLTHRVGSGLSFTSNYTYGKSIDDASDAGTDKNVISTGRVDGQVALGGTRNNDRSVSIFDLRHIWNSTFLWDLPLGKGRHLMSHAPAPLEAVAGNWTVSGALKIESGFPAMATLSDTNFLGDLTHTARPNIVPGVPIVNPLFDMNCPIGNLCQPYLNPAAFVRPPKGTLGDAPRTLDGARGPWQQFFDVSFQKNFPLGEKRKIQFRVDLINAFNHPTYRVFLNNQGGTDFMGAPSEQTISATDYNNWATANGRPLSNTPAGAALMTQIQQIVISNRLPTGALPASFYSIPLPQSFWATNANQYDITTLNGYKLYRLRQAYNAGFGQLYYPGGGSGFTSPRYIQFGIKIFF